MFRGECPGPVTFSSHIRLPISDNVKAECVEELMVHPVDGGGSGARTNGGVIFVSANFGAAVASVRLRAACVTHVGGYEGRFGNNFISQRNLRAREAVEQESKSGTNCAPAD